MVLSKTSAVGVWVPMLAAAGLAASLMVLTAFASEAYAAPNTNKATSGTQAASCTGDIVLDPGHGGTDSGAVNSNGITEKDQTLTVAYELKSLLETDDPQDPNDQKHKVCMTRGGDPSNPSGKDVKDPGDHAFADNATLSNSDRYTFANTTGAKVLISIHMNGSTNTATDYTTTLFGKWQKDKKLAETVYQSLSTLPSANDSSKPIATRAPYSYASGVLLKSIMPATITETVFVTNAKEGELLSQQPQPNERQKQIAKKLEQGIENYL